MAGYDDLRLQTMLKLVQLIRDRLKDVEQQEFLGSLDHVDLTAFRLQHIGEAAHHLSADLKLRNPDVRWRSIIGMRNFLAHSYEDIKATLLWKTFIEDLDAIEAMCRAELDK